MRLFRGLGLVFKGLSGKEKEAGKHTWAFIILSKPMCILG